MRMPLKLPAHDSTVAADAASREGIDKILTAAGAIAGGSVNAVVVNGGSVTSLGDVFGDATWSDKSAEETIRVFRA